MHNDHFPRYDHLFPTNTPPTEQENSESSRTIYILRHHATGSGEPKPFTNSYSALRALLRAQDTPEGHEATIQVWQRRNPLSDWEQVTP